MDTDQLDRQIQALADDAAPNLAPETIHAIAPVLKAFAQQLKHSEYFVVQTLEQQMVMTHLFNRQQPDQKKTVIYAHSSLNDVKNGPVPLNNSPNLLAMPMPVTHILFQLMAMKRVESVIFLETPGNVAVGTEVRRRDLEASIQLQLQKSKQNSAQVPPDMA